MNEYKEPFAVKTDKRTLADAFMGADVFIGLSIKGLVSKEMVASMADDPIIFALANPDPEILPEEVLAEPARAFRSASAASAARTRWCHS